MLPVKLLSLSICLFLSQCCLAQIVNIDTVHYTNSTIKRPELQSDDFKFSVSMAFFTIRQLPSITNQTYNTALQNAYVPNIGLKFREYRFSYRLMASVLDKQFAFTCSTCEISAGRVQDYLITVGFQKDFSSNIFSPYVGIDLGYQTNRFSGESSSSRLRLSADFSTSTARSGIVFGPLAGIQFQPANRLTILAESSMKFLYSGESKKNVYANRAPETSSKNFSWQFLPTPLSTTIQYNFGQVY